MLYRAGCSFCEEVRSGAAHDSLLQFVGAPRIERRVWSDADHIVVPSLGPLTDDHCLVISRAHHRCLRDAPFEARKIAVERAHQLAQELERRSQMPSIMFENGSSHSRQTNGTCVDHLHIHVLTVSIFVIEAMEKMLAMQPADNDWARVADNLDKSQDYVILSLLGSRTRLTSAPEIDRQRVRKALAFALGRPLEWDWRSYPKLNTIATIMQRLSGLDLMEDV